MKKKQSIPSAFENAFEGLGFQNVEETGGVTNVDDALTVDEEGEDFTEPDGKSEDEKETGKKDGAHDDDTKIPDEVLNQINNQNDNDDKGSEESDGNDIDDLDVTEAKQISALFDAVAESFGWDMSEIDEDKRPVTVEGLTDYLKTVVEENSVPEYADERIQQLDEFVKNGGKFEDFYAAKQAELSYDNIDLDDESNQKAVVREFLKIGGYTEEQINNKINRYEDADMLEEEATEALGRLKSIKAQQTKEMHAQQEAARKQQEEQQKQFFEDVSNQINNLSSIRGLSVPKEDRKALFNYIFKTDADGLSQYQKDFNKNMSKNLIESAYFTMNAEKLIQEAKKTGETTAAQKLRQMLRHTSKNHSSYNAQEEKTRPAWEIASKFL